MHNTTSDTKIKQFDFNIGSRKIPYFLGENCLQDFAFIIQDFKPDKVFVITDETISSFHKNKVFEVFSRFFECKWLTIPAGESEKNISTISTLCNHILNANCTRNSIIVPFGGGVIGNIAGLVSSLLFRGIRFIHLPSTLLAMHDSVTSAKQAVNHAHSKNILGAYFYPEAILTDVAFLNTLSFKHILSGKAELVKNALIFGGEHYQSVKALIDGEDADNLMKMVELGIEAKASLLCIDPFEKKQAIIFEYGHTIGHGIELCFKGALSHGESVAIGMKYAAMISNELGLLSAESLKKHQEIIDLLHPKLPGKSFNPKDVMRFCHAR